LLITCAPSAVDAVMAILNAEDFDQAAVVGSLVEGAAGLELV
jgi:selenide,water dikinase